MGSEMCIRDRRRSTLDEFSSRLDDVSYKRGCVDSTVSLGLDRTGSERTRLPQSADPPDLVNGGQHEGTTDRPLMRQVPSSLSTLDKESVSSPVRQHLPVIPRPRFPAAMLPTPPLAAIFNPSASMTAAVHNITPLTPPPFCFAPSVDYSTAVPLSSPTLPPPPPSLFAFYHPAFWGAVPYLIGRAVLGVEQIQEDPLSGCLLYTSPSPRDGLLSRMPSSA